VAPWRTNDPAKTSRHAADSLPLRAACPELMSCFRRFGPDAVLAREGERTVQQSETPTPQNVNALKRQALAAITSISNKKSGRTRAGTISSIEAGRASPKNFALTFA
jgi:hypothetical protein